MKLVLPIFLSVVTILLALQSFYFIREKNEAAYKLGEAEKSLNQATLDNEKLKSELEYFSNPANLEKEIRARFNLKKPGERMIILVPQPESGTSSVQKPWNISLT